jgi:hypothetical protein
LKGSVGISLKVVVFMFAYLLRDGLSLVLSGVDKLAAVVSPSAAPPYIPALEVLRTCVESK